MVFIVNNVTLAVSFSSHTEASVSVCLYAFLRFEALVPCEIFRPTATVFAATWPVLYEGVKTYSSLYSVFFNIPWHLAVLINVVTLPGDGFPIQCVVMNILQLIVSRDPAASCLSQLSVWIKAPSHPHEPEYHSSALKDSNTFTALYSESQEG